MKQLRKMYVEVNRGMTDKTVVAVFPWEVPILEEVHGTGCTEITVDEMCEIRGAAKIEKVKVRNEKADPLLSLREQHMLALSVPRETDPRDNPDGEWERMIGKYGMHPRIEMPMVEKVYGSKQQFKAVVLGHGTPTEEVKDGVAEVPAEEKPLAEYTRAEAAAKLDFLGIVYKKSASRDELIDMLVEREAA